jgi:hypothetical protein
MDDSIPRRARIDLLLPGEWDIRKALVEVEALGAHSLLTDVVVLLTRAKDTLADWYDGGCPGKSWPRLKRTVTYQAPAVWESDAFPVFLPADRDARTEADLIAAAVAKASNEGWDVVAVVPSFTTERHYLVVCRRMLLGVNDHRHTPY